MTKKLLAVTLLAAASITCGCAPSLHTDVPLVWKPTSDIYSGSPTLTGMYAEKFKVLPFVDQRSNKTEIAKNIEDGREKPVTTKDDVAAWCTDKFKAIFKQYGLAVVDDHETVTVKGEILNFYVTEDNLYRSNVGIRVTAERPKGKVLWQGLISGNAKRFGRSYSLENYYESISDAYLEAVSGLLNNQEFKNAMGQKL
ncbi:MAG TPA: hypothetical protein VK187_02350 [Geobacteraceae bacterium]|nr:hypothetical protein [Geobacteraceae bacterium]